MFDSAEHLAPPNPDYRVGLSLSGGGAKGIAHLGVIKALEEVGMKPEIIAGVSAGAIIGALYADGKTPLEICDFFRETSFFKFVNVVVPKKGLMSSDRFQRMLEGYLTAKTFEELSMPLIVNATELKEGKCEYFDSGVLVDRVVASSSIPIFLTPKEMNGKVYVDGGIFNNMPARIIRHRCKHLVGVHVNPIVTEGDINGMLDVAERVYHLSIQASTVIEKRACDLVIEPVKARNYSLFGISKTKVLFDIGYDCAMKELEKYMAKKQIT